MRSGPRHGLPNASRDGRCGLKWRRCQTANWRAGNRVRRHVNHEVRVVGHGTKLRTGCRTLRDEYDLEAEKQEIFGGIGGCSRPKFKKRLSARPSGRLDVALEAHKDIRRKAESPTSTTPSPSPVWWRKKWGCDDQHRVRVFDTVEDTYMTLDDVERLFGPKERALWMG